MMAEPEHSSHGSRLERAAFALGRPLVELARTTRALYVLFAQTLYYVVRGRREPGALLAQMYAIGNRSLLLLTIVMGFIGMILVLQAGLQTQRVVPDLSMLGPTYLQLLVRDLAASLGALMLATRVGAGIAAELGSMVVTEQIDALRMCGADPVDYLVKPRFLASLVMTTVLTICSGAVASGTGLVTAWLVFAVPPRTFFGLQLIHPSDLLVGLSKCVAYGAAIPIVSAWSGLNTFGGSQGVGTATTRAVVASSLVVIMLNLAISSAALAVFP
jgi:phospholipid/cholesterol/gamma-HCH transport system permease protein